MIVKVYFLARSAVESNNVRFSSCSLCDFCPIHNVFKLFHKVFEFCFFLCYICVKLIINYLVLDIFLSVVQMCVAVVVRIYILWVLFVECNFAWNLSLGLLYIILKHS